jgi:REP element-mobilizing transposase RayT
MANFTELFVHLVWATRDREPSITRALEARLHARLAAKCRDLRCNPIAIGGIADHVHVLVALHPTISVSLLAKELKGASSHFVTHVAVPGSPFGWQTGYGAFTLRHDELPTVSAYVRQQARHHSGGSLVPDWERTSAED